MRKFILIGSTFAGALALAATAGATEPQYFRFTGHDQFVEMETSGNPPELLVSNFNTRAGKWAPLKARTTYQASAFPIALHLTPRDETWAGAQWKKSSHGKPAFGWVAVGQGPVNAPLGLIELETAFGPTPPVAAILARLRSAGSGATFGKTTRVALAGFRGWQIDGTVFSRFGHVFVPFSPTTGGASPPDHYRLDKGEAFRVIVVDVRGKRVVLFFENFALPAEQFPAFLTSANRLLKTLKFPAS